MAEIPQEWFEGATLGRKEVASTFNVDPTTVTKWAKQGVIGFYRTPGGVRCYPECEVRRIANNEPAPGFIKELADEDNQRSRTRWLGGYRRNEHFAAHVREETGDAGGRGAA